MNGKLFATVRKVNGLTQTEMAQRLNVSRSLIQKVEADERRIKPYLEAKIYIEFGTDHVDEVKRITKDYLKGAL